MLNSFDFPLVSLPSIWYGSGGEGVEVGAKKNHREEACEVIIGRKIGLIND